MTLDELETIKRVLQHAQVDEDVSFGPAVSAWIERRDEAMKIVKREMKKLKEEK